MTDRYTKVLLTIITLSLIWLGVKDTRLEPVVSAQSATWEEQFQDWDENALPARGRVRPLHDAFKPSLLNRLPLLSRLGGRFNGDGG